jgi:hypothetical protein
MTGKDESRSARLVFLQPLRKGAHVGGHRDAAAAGRGLPHPNARQGECVLLQIGVAVLGPLIHLSRRLQERLDLLLVQGPAPCGNLLAGGLLDLDLLKGIRVPSPLH